MARRGTIPVGLAVIDSEPVGSDVIERLEEVFEQARAGEVSSVAIALVYRDGSSDRVWSQAPSLSSLIGSVSRLQAALIRRADCGE